VDAVRRLLDCDDVAAQAVLDMSWRRLTRANRERIAAERAECAARASRRLKAVSCPPRSRSCRYGRRA
jgi:DNA gyrase/topoisomerase IV subunit A